MNPLALRVAVLHRWATYEEDVLEDTQKEAKSLLERLVRSDSALTKLIDWLETCQRLLRAENLQETIDKTREFQNQTRILGINPLRNLLGVDDLAEFRREVFEIGRALDTTSELYELYYLEEQLWDSPVCRRLVDKVDNNEDIASDIRGLKDWG